MARPRRFPNPALFVCDIQEKFRPAIFEYDKVISTAHKMIKACYTLRIPIFSTTQSASRLGSLCHELTSIETVHTFPIIDKTAFSMLVPQLRDTLTSRSSYPYQVAIVGIETHICVTQTALDLLSEGHRVYVIMDGVSSCHEGERAVALDRLRQEGAIVTTSESFLYECMGDASIPEFKAIAGLVKETKDNTRDAVQTLCKM
ncbi:hypothetical protein MMC21_005134 [Puttea exsequens]|nr:hypothetical protein [Puttea exsequens]